MKRLAAFFLVALLLLPGLAQAKIFLVDTDDTLRVVTASGVSTIHMYAAWADLTTTALTPGASDAQVTTATTTVLVAAPGASTQRQIKGLSIRNSHASSSNLITVQFFDGATATELIAYTLLAGETLQWGEDENFRIIDASGQVKGIVAATQSGTWTVTANAGTGTFNIQSNASVNVAQMNGVTTSMGVGASGTGTQRVASVIHDGTDTAQVTTTSGGSLQVECAAGCSGGTQYAEDSVHASGDTLTLAGVVQQSTDAALAGDGDRTLLQVDGTGYLKVINKNPNLAADNSSNSTSKVPTLGALAGSSAPTWTSGNQVPLSVDTSGALRVTGGTSATQYTEDAASAGAESLTLAGAIRQNTPASSTSADGDYSNIKVDSSGRLWVNGSDVTQPVSGTVSITANSAVNVAQVNGSTAQVATNSMNTTGSGLQASSLAAQCDDTTPTSLTENQFGNLRMNCTDHSLKVDHQSIAGNTVSTGNGVSGTGVQRVTIASDSTGQVALATGTNTIGNAGIVPVTSGGTSVCYLTSAASTNSTNCKASAGQLYGYDLVNTTTTIYYLRIYNSSGAPTCSSATGFIRTIPVPPAAAAGGAGGVARSLAVGEAYGTGLGFCLTGGGSSTDNTNAATGVYVTLNYK